LVAASYASGTYADQDVIGLLQRVENPGAAVQALLQTATGAEQRNLQQVLPLAQTIDTRMDTDAPRPGGIFSSLMSLLVPIILVVVITPILLLIWRLLFYPNIVAPLWDKIRPKSEEELHRRKELHAEKQARLAPSKPEKSGVEMDDVLGQPTIQKLSVYTKGRQFDDSFAIEDANDMFLGECGTSAAKTLGPGNDLAAIEVWLFDKEDFVRTLTKVFVSDLAYNDPAIRSELELKVENPATDIIPVSDGAKLILETDALRMQASVKSFNYGVGALPPNSHFDAINIEVAVWQKQVQLWAFQHRHRCLSARRNPCQPTANSRLNQLPDLPRRYAHHPDSTIVQPAAYALQSVADATGQPGYPATFATTFAAPAYSACAIRGTR